MPPKMSDDKMKLPELKRLIKKYDELMGIDPKNKSRDDLIKEIEKLGYKIDHQKKVITAKFKQKTKKMPKKVEAPAPAKKKPAKSKAEKDKEMREKVIKYILANKDILNDDRLK